MIYKVIEDKKWEYKTVIVKEYDINHNQLDSLLDGDDGWEAFSVIPLSNQIYRIFLKRSYIEQAKYE